MAPPGCLSMGPITYGINSGSVTKISGIVLFHRRQACSSIRLSLPGWTFTGTEAVKWQFIFAGLITSSRPSKPICRYLMYHSSKYLNANGITQNSPIAFAIGLFCVIRTIGTLKLYSVFLSANLNRYISMTIAKKEFHDFSV